jgi:hypothetical protein
MPLQLYKELYAEEAQRREQLQTSAGTPISIVTVLGGGLLLMGKTFESSHPVLYVPFWMAFGIAAGCLAGAVYCIVRSVNGYVYQRIPYATQLARHQMNLRDLGASTGKLESAQLAFEEYLLRKYATAAESNAVINENRGEWLNRANRSLVYALCTTAIAGIPVAIQIKTAPERAQKIEITNLRSRSDVESESVFGAPWARRFECSASAAGPGRFRAVADSAGGAP